MNNNLSEQDDLMMVELNESFLEESVFTSYDIDNSDQEDMKEYIKLIALLISSKNPETLLDNIYTKLPHKRPLENTNSSSRKQLKRSSQPADSGSIGTVFGGYPDFSHVSPLNNNVEAGNEETSK